MSLAPDTFYITGGTLPRNASSYVSRRADADLLDGLRQGEFCYVLNTRQIGKSSLMVRTAQRLRQEGVRVALLDLTAVGQNVSVEEWYDGLLTLLAEQLRCEDELEAFWMRHHRLGPMQKWMLALREVVLQSDTPVCIFVDEIDGVRSLPFSTDEFFAGIRECYNRRAQDAAFARLTFCLLGVAAPADLIADPRTSPFNIGKRILLTDFTPEEAAPLGQGFHHRDTETQRNHRGTGGGNHGEHGGHGEGERQKEKGEEAGVSSSFILHPSSFAAPLNRILYWTDGHPYLTQRLCRALAEAADGEGVLTRQEVDRACETLFLSRQAQLTDDNLAFARSRMLHGDMDRAALLDLYRQILRGRAFRDDATHPLHNVLRLAGVVKVSGGQLVVRNRIYAQVFDRAWIEANMPDEEARRQRAAYRRGVARTAGMSAVVLLAVGGLAGVAVKQAHTAQRAETKATEQQRLAVERLSRSYVDAGTRLMEQGDAGGAMAPLIEAMVLDQDDAARMRMHRLRFASALSHAPRLDRMWFTDKPLRWASFSPDKTRVAACGDDGRAHVWRVDTGAELPLEMKHEGSVTYAAFSPDGGRLATCGQDNIVRVWDLNAPRLLCALPSPKKLQGRPGITQAAWNRDGRMLAACSQNVIRVWNVSGAGTSNTGIGAADSLNGAALIFDERISNNSPNAITFSPDSTHIVVVSDNYSTVTASILNVRPGTVTKEEYSVWDNTADETGTSWHGNHIAYSADGRRLLLAGSFGRQSQRRGVGVYDLISPFPFKGPPAQHRFQRALLEHSNYGTYSAFSPDEKRIVTASEDGTARVWDAQTGSALTPSMAHEAAVTQATFSPDGQRVLTASLDGAARVWNAQTGTQAAPPLRHAGAIVSAQWGADSAHVLTAGSDGTARLWTLPSPAPDATQFADTYCGFEQIAGGKRLVVGIYFSPPKLARHYIVDIATCARLSPSVNTISWQKVALDAKKRRAIFFQKSGPGYQGKDRMQVWDCEQGQPLSPLMPAMPVALSHGGDLLLWRDPTSGMVSISKAAGGTPVGTPFYCGVENPESNYPEYAFTPDDRGVVACDRANNVAVRDVVTGRALTPPMPHQSPVQEVLFSPNGRYLFTETIDNVVRIWNIPAGTPATPPLPRVAESVVWNSQSLRNIVFSPDGHWALAYAQSSNSPLLWPLDGSSTLHPRLLGQAEWIPGVNNIMRFSNLHGFSPDSEKFIALETGASVRSVQDGAAPVPMLSHGARITGIKFSPDSRRMVSASLDGTARIWNVQTMQPAAPTLRHGGTVETALFSPDGRLVATVGGGLARVWDSATGEAITPPLALVGEIGKLEFTPDGRRLVAATKQEGRIWTLPDTSADLARLRATAQLLSGQRYGTASELTPLDNAALRAAWQQTQSNQHAMPNKNDVGR